MLRKQQRNLFQHLELTIQYLRNLHYKGLTTAQINIGAYFSGSVTHPNFLGRSTDCPIYKTLFSWERAKYSNGTFGGNALCQPRGKDGGSDATFGGLPLPACTLACISSKFICTLPHTLFNQFPDYFTYTYTFILCLFFEPLIFFVSKANWVNFFLDYCHSIKYLIHCRVVDILYDIKSTSQNATQIVKHLVEQMLYPNLLSPLERGYQTNLL